MPCAIVTGSGSPLSVLVSTTASSAHDGAVDWHHLPGAHDHEIARLHLLDRHLLDVPADAALGDLGGALHRARSALAALVWRPRPQAPRRPRTSARRAARRAPVRARATRPSRPARSCRLPCGGRRRPCARPRPPARAASSATAARQTSSPAAPCPVRCSGLRPRARARRPRPGPVLGARLLRPAAGGTHAPAVSRARRSDRRETWPLHKHRVGCPWPHP